MKYDNGSGNNQGPTNDTMGLRPFKYGATVPVRHCHNIVLPRISLLSAGFMLWGESNKQLEIPRIESQK
jgi:hypothetical protein